MDIKNLSVDNVHCFKNDEVDGIVFSWSANIGWGDLTLYKYRNNDEKWKADTECMCSNEDKDFIRQILNKWVDEMEIK